jgi:hypothetical protein
LWGEIEVTEEEFRRHTDASQIAVVDEVLAQSN